MGTIDFANAYQAGFHGTVRFLVSKGMLSHLAEEYAQAAWARGWERLSQLRDHRAINGWIKQIAWHYYLHQLAAMKLDVPLLEICNNESANIAAIDVEQILETCAPADQLLLRQCLRGFTSTEIADMVGATPGAIRIRLMRARRSARCAVLKQANTAPL